MKKFFKVLKYFLLAILLIVMIGFAVVYFMKSNASKANFSLLGDEAKTIAQNGLSIRDLNNNGKVDIYEDPSAEVDARVDNLVSQMNMEEKAGSMFINMIGTTPEGGPMETPIISLDPINLMMSIILPSNSEMIARKKMNSFNILASLDAEQMAKYNNTIQKMAERTRLGVYRNHWLF